jgi:hypothetical protein
MFHSGAISSFPVPPEPQSTKADRQSIIQNPPSNISASATRYQQPATAAAPQSKIQNPASKIFLSPIPPVAVFAATRGSGFVEMILHPLLIQKFIKIKLKKFDD